MAEWSRGMTGAICAWGKWVQFRKKAKASKVGPAQSTNKEAPGKEMTQNSGLVKKRLERVVLMFPMKACALYEAFGKIFIKLQN